MDRFEYLLLASWLAELIASLWEVLNELWTLIH